MSGLTIEAKKRDMKGKNNAGRLRRDGNIPANLIGKGKALDLQIAADEFEQMIASGLRQSQIIDMNLDGENVKVIVKEVQRHPVNSKVQHIDFIRIEKGVKTQLKIAIETRGIAKGVKTGGALEHFIRTIRVKAVPESFQDCIEVDITNFDVNDGVYLKDLNIPESWDVLLQGNPLVLKVSSGRIAAALDEMDNMEGEAVQTDDEKTTEAKTESEENETES